MRRRAAVLGDGLVMQWPLPHRPLESEWPAKMDEMRRWRREAGIGRTFRLELDTVDGQLERFEFARDALDGLMPA